MISPQMLGWWCAFIYNEKKKKGLKNVWGRKRASVSLATPQPPRRHGNGGPVYGRLARRADHFYATAHCAVNTPRHRTSARVWSDFFFFFIIEQPGYQNLRLTA